VVIIGVIGPHDLFHVAVLAGLAWHWVFIRNLLILKQAESQGANDTRGRTGLQLAR